ncbi:hypothetical protein [Photobacterium phage PDCC-1]|uniref:Uncharacterized protein n=1 Tax=Photobacterium phage PDCC-1 TaxID=2664246 RepID=A0A6B9J4S3_9CAUD|nr:hypothetical protein HWC77_gp085 [Photobacterium phage PDCC-1]QGZ14448.1 hypothetical protein [Photobacterium phage PDCC-1]
MPDADKRMTSRTIQFGTIVGLLLLLIVISLMETFSSRNDGMSKESIAQLENILETFKQINKESRLILEENRKSNLELSRFLEEKKGVRRETYQSMMDEYQQEMKGVIPSGSIDESVQMDPDIEEPGPEG